MADRKLGCLSIFLFVALWPACAGIFVNFILMIAALGRMGGTMRAAEPIPRFREIVVQRGGFQGFSTTTPYCILILSFAGPDQLQHTW